MATRKRARVDSGEFDAQKSTLVVLGDSGQGDDLDAASEKDREFWYEDGNIIIHAGNVEFRVFKGILAEHSPVFKDMFSLPQPHEKDSCSAVHVTDSPEDIRHIFRVYMPKSQPSPFMPLEPSYNMISASIRLGHKYQMWNLIEHAVAFLKVHYPTDLDAWHKVSTNDGSPASFYLQHAIGVVNLARLASEDSILPTALLVCCTLGSAIVEGFVREDGTREQLSLEDIGLCFGAKDRLVSARIASALRTFDSHSATGCTNKSECRYTLRSIVNQLHECAALLAEPNPFKSNVSLCQDRATGLCSSCFAMVCNRDIEERRAAWKCLPELIGIEVPGWEDDGDKQN